MERHDPPNGPSHDDAETSAADEPAASEPGTDAAGEPSTGPTTAHDALRRLEQRLDRASEAAERLISEAAQSAASAAGRVPPAGWQIPRTESDPAGEPGGGGETELLVHVVQSLRDLIPPELQRRLAEAIRELLIAVRALIDWYLERIERNRTEPAEVEDIPIL
jgi:hypothetical protein